MKSTNVNTSKLRLAQVRYFDEEKNGTEIPRIKAYAFLQEVNGVYVNLLDPTEELPVYERTPYTNTTLDGEDFGTKIILAQGEEKEGPCFVLEKVNVRELFGRDIVTIEDVEKYVLKSEMFFVDRMSLIKEKKGFIIHLGSRLKVMEDSKKFDEMNAFFAGHKKGIQYHK